ncbi:MAG TPA: SGNH/GDSL hydrolase family protein [Thermoanaerobaculia bacterium]|nr:SGNH/GDSL hydrolase family protein [Thermoanaerobaculia bacterium]
MLALKLARQIFAATLLTAALLGAGEVGLRLLGRWRDGRWPQSQAGGFYDRIRMLRRIYRTHPFLNTAPRKGGRVAAFGRQVVLNRLGYRSPERPAAKPPGVRRVLVAGGSTTFDLLAADNEHSWPSRLEARLRAGGTPVEVWNAGFPGWTTLESLISLAFRDLDLGPDMVVLFHGINDLQPAAHQPFDPQYEHGHAEVSRRALGLELKPPAWWEESLLSDRLRDLARGPVDPWQTLAAPTPTSAGTGGRRLAIAPEAVGVFARNARSFAALAAARGARVILVTQTMRLRAANRARDVAYLEGWYPGLAAEAAPAELEKLNGALRELAAAGTGELADAARDVAWTDDDFGDPLHVGDAGRGKLVAYLALRLTTALAAARPR